MKTCDSSSLTAAKAVQVAAIIALVPVSHLLADYLSYEPAALVQLVLIAAGLMCLMCVEWVASICRKDVAAFGVVSAVFSCSIVLGKHVVINGDAYSGTAAECYISEYSAIDAVALIAFTLLFTMLSVRILAFMRHRGGVSQTKTVPLVSYRYSPVNRTWLLILALGIFVCWVPYLLTYFPGLVLGDTYSSLYQATGQMAWDNHHPVLFTLLLKACIELVGLFGRGVAAGCALFCLGQMTFMAAAFSYMACWLRSRFALPAWIPVIVAAFFALTPHFGALSVAFWKDPLFSSGVMLVSLIVADIALSGFSLAVATRGRLVCFVAAGLLVCLMRNNGVLIAVVLAVVLFVVALRSARGGVRRKVAGVLGACSLVVTVTSLVITGPVYTAFGVAPSESAEGLGIPLNQMARVAALDGNMSESDREYMDSILPIEEYAEKYRPCCTDKLKWDKEFNSEPLNDTKEFLGHWVSMLARNPQSYFEAWELQTFGYWAVNVPCASETRSDISRGIPIVDAYIADFGITAQNLLDSDSARKVFPLDDWSVSGGMLLWALMYLSVLLWLTGRRAWVLVLVPSFGLVLSLLVASPVWYWPRYVAALQFLLPVYIVLMFSRGVKDDF